MIVEVYMPKNGMDMTEGKIVRWLKNEGDSVEKDEPIMEIETDKITMESEAPGAGILLKKLYGDGETVPVLTTIGYIGEKGDKLPDKTEIKESVSEKAKEPEVKEQERPQAIKTDGGIVAATPYAKKLAKDNGIDLSTVVATGKYGEVRARDVENCVAHGAKITPLAKAVADAHGVDLSQVAGSGYGGKITRSDVEGRIGTDVRGAEASGQAEETTGLVRKKLSTMRKVTARRMFASHNEIPTVTQNVKVDVTELLLFREKINHGKEKGEKVSVNDIIIKAVAKVVAEQERYRMTIEGDEYVLHDRVNIGFAVGMYDGLLVPVIKDADKKGLLEISKEAKKLAANARDGKLQPSDLKDGRITISNLGMYGTHSFTPIINQPEAAILGVCAVEDELALDGEKVVVRKKMMICLTYDHRIINGTEACTFESRLKELLENPIDVLL